MLQRSITPGRKALTFWAFWVLPKRLTSRFAEGAGAAIGAVRVAQGGHFFSDVVFSGWAVWLTYLLIRYIWLVHRLRRFKDCQNTASSLK